MVSLSRQHLILTVNGVAGACSAALVLMKHSDARVCITSPRHLPYALNDLAEEAFSGVIHICGIGVSGPFDDILPSLVHVTEKAACIWHSGKQHPEIFQHRKALEKHCELALTEHRTDTESIAKYLKPPDSARVLLLSELAEEEQAGRKPRSEYHKYCHDLVTAANRRFYFFGDDTLNEQVFRFLAGQEEKIHAHDEAVEEYRRSSDALYPLGSSRAMKELRRQIGLIGPVPEPVLIMGPTGSGKEVMAKALHVTSSRKGEFVTVNCAVLGGNPALVEDRLFGHVKGAYTGATSDCKGAFDEAHEGTLFLDEIGELPPEVQSQLLRVLEEKAVRPLGTMKTHSVEVRIVAATHRDLSRMVSQGTFREDLYYRLNVLAIRVAPLRERPEDMKSIAAHIGQELENKGYVLKLGKEDWDVLRGYEWPGNVRQFLNILKRAAYLQKPVRNILVEEEVARTRTTTDDMGEMLRLYCPRTPEEISPVDTVYQAYVRHVFDLLDGNITRTARLLQIAPNTLRKHVGGST